MLGINEIYINLMFRLVSHPVASHCVCVNLKSKIKKEKKSLQHIWSQTVPVSSRYDDIHCIFGV